MPKHIMQPAGGEFLDHGERNDDIRDECIVCGKVDPPKDEECDGVFDPFWYVFGEVARQSAIALDKEIMGELHNPIEDAFYEGKEDKEVGA